MRKAKLDPKTIITYTFSVFASVILIYPLIFSVLSSFKDNNEIYGHIFSLPKVWRFENYKESFEIANMGLCITNSILYAVISTFLALILSSMVSFIISRYSFKLNNALYIYFTLGLMVPVYSLIIPISKMVSSIKGSNSYFVMIILYLTFQLPLSIFLITGYMRGISKEIDESAIIDGCSTFKLWYKIIIPLSMPAISTAGILGFLDIYNDLIWAVMFINKQTMYNISLGLFSFVGQMGSVKQGPTFASIILTIVPTIIIYLTFQEKVENGLTAGAVKG